MTGTGQTSVILTSIAKVRMSCHEGGDMSIDRGRAQLQGSSRTVGAPISVGPLLVTAESHAPQKASIFLGRKTTDRSSALRSEVESAGLLTKAMSTKVESNLATALGSQIGSGSRVSMESEAAAIAKTYLPGPSAQQPIALRAESSEREQTRSSGFEVGNHQLVADANALKASKLAGYSSQFNLDVATIPTTDVMQTFLVNSSQWVDNLPALSPTPAIASLPAALMGTGSLVDVSSSLKRMESIFAEKAERE